jgi:hypothetical protein
VRAMTGIQVIFEIRQAALNLAVKSSGTSRLGGKRERL